MRNKNFYKNLFILSIIYGIAAVIIDCDGALQVVSAVLVSYLIVKIIRYLFTCSFSLEVPTMTDYAAPTSYTEFSSNGVNKAKKLNVEEFFVPANDTKVAEKIDYHKSDKVENYDAEVLNPVQIDINKASAEEIANLAGINLIMAKKIIQYRNTKGYFKNIDTFFEVSGVKEHFKDKLSKMIVIKTPTDKRGIDNDDCGRIVDI